MNRNNYERDYDMTNVTNIYQWLGERDELPAAAHLLQKVHRGLRLGGEHPFDRAKGTLVDLYLYQLTTGITNLYHARSALSDGLKYSQYCRIEVKRIQEILRKLETIKPEWA